MTGSLGGHEFSLISGVSRFQEIIPVFACCAIEASGFQTPVFEHERSTVFMRAIQG
jgi:hypothetical protein